MNQRGRQRVPTALVGTAAFLLPLLTLTGCSYASHDCSQGLCGVLLNGSGAVSGFQVTCLGIGEDELTIEVSR